MSGTAHNALKGSLFAALAVASATGAEAAPFKTTTLTTPVSFDLSAGTPTTPLAIDLNGDGVTDFTIASGIYNFDPSIVIDGGPNNYASYTFAVAPGVAPPFGFEGLAASVSSTGDIGSFSDYDASFPALPPKVETGVTVLAQTDTNGENLLTNLPSGDGYVPLFFGPGHTAGFIGFTNTVTGDVGGVQNDVFELTSYGFAVPEPETWGLLILGASLMGGALRQRRRTVAAQAA